MTHISPAKVSDTGEDKDETKGDVKAEAKGGHYTSTIKKGSVNWYNFNDSTIRPVYNAMNSNYVKGGYMYFYRKRRPIVSSEKEEGEKGEKEEVDTLESGLSFSGSSY